MNLAEVLLMERPNGEVVPSKAGLAALAQAQDAFADASAGFGVSNEDAVQSLVDDVRGRVS